MRGNPYHHLNAAFLETMDELGRYGAEKYGPLPKVRSDHRDPTRVSTEALKIHAEDHFDAYQRNIPHDHFNTRRHQLAAVAFNAMMEFYFAELEHDPWEL